MANTVSNKRLDPTKMINQPALRSSTGRVWLIMGGLFAVAVLVPFVLMIVNLTGRTRGIAIATSTLVVTLYLFMVVAKFAIEKGTTRLRVMGACMLAMAAFAFIGALVASWSEWSAV